MRGDLPRGTVTFLFTDIEGSTRLLHALGPEAYAEALAEHRRALREAFVAEGGVEVDTQGDAFFVAFPTADGAAAAALAANEALGGGPIHVRMGLHTGAPAVTDEGYVGIDVHRGARVAALAHGGQIVLSPATAALVDGSPLRDLGPHRLKDFEGAARLFQLGPGQFPVLRTPGSVDLPTPATTFIGRERELLDGISVVFDRDPRVLTIVGPGGTGKTRFVIELARLLAEEAEGGTLFVPLAPLRDPALVLPALAEALGAEAGDVEAIAGRLRGKRTHVVLDNVEQLLPDAARYIAGLADAAPSLRLLVTSREALRIGAETQLELPPLPADDAADLFVSRARSVRPDVDRSAVVDELCERLDHLPLAVELAAARTKLLSPEALLQRLAARLDLPAPRDADPRHATLNATIAWSYDLLDKAERRLFARLAVFRGGCTLEAAEEVCSADLDTLASLLDKSLLRRRQAGDGSDRFWMLETIREFAGNRLSELGDMEAVQRAHALRLLELATRAGSTEYETMGRAQLDLIAAELDNVRAALDWCLASDPTLGLELAVALEGFWVIREPVEGAGWEARMLDSASDAPPELRAAGWRALGGAFDIVGERDRAEPCYRESLELFERIGDEEEIAFLRFRLGANAVNRGDTEAGWPLIEASLEDFRRLAQPAREAQALSYLASKADSEGDLDGAVELSLRSVALVRSVGWSWWEGMELIGTAEFERRRGNHAAARGRAQEALVLAVELGNRLGSVFAAAELACAAAALGDVVTAGRLWGAIEGEEAAAPVGQWPDQRAGYELLVVQPDTEFEQARTEGRLISIAEAAALSDA
jgi:predicted ATPase/class 3 adenylate cyclase